MSPLVWVPLALLLALVAWLVWAAVLGIHAMTQLRNHHRTRLAELRARLEALKERNPS